MKQKNLLIALLCLLTAGFARSETVSPYTVDFDTPITTSDHNFKVSQGWKHFVHKYTDDYGFNYWMSYSFFADNGVDNSGTLLAYEQKAGDTWDNETTFDMLVTPPVSGTITLDVKGYSGSASTSYVQFYTMDDSGTKHGTKIAEFKRYTDFDGTGEIGDWKTITLDLEAHDIYDPTQICIRASYVYLDNFTATNAKIEPEASIEIISYEPSSRDTRYWPQQTDGTLKPHFTVVIKNNGQVDLTEASKNYSISILDAKDQVIGTQKLTQALAIGETSDPIDIDIVVAKDDIKKFWGSSGSTTKVYLRENLQGSKTETWYYGYKPYEPKFVFRKAGASNTSSSPSNNTAIAFGTVSEETPLNYEIFNDGAAPLTIKSIEVSGDFTCSVTNEEFIIGAGETSPVTITLPASSTGSKSGTFKIVYLDKDDKETTHTNPLSGTVVNANSWYADFDNTSSTAIYPDGCVMESAVGTDYQYSAGKYNIWLKTEGYSSNKDSDNKFITPKLDIKAGDKISFDIARYKNATGNDIKVYKSTDRLNWGEPIATYLSSDLSDNNYHSQEISFDGAGEYYIAFAIYGMKLDNIVAPQQVEVAHDIYIKKFTQSETVQTGKEATAEIEIIPVKGESAENYTIKYIVNNEVVATEESLNLPASPYVSKKFTFTYTPETETTVTYQGHIEMEFTDGVKVVSGSLPIKITNDPEFSFIKAQNDPDNYNPRYKPYDYTSDISFGKVNELNLVQNFDIFNFGTAPLTVKSITLPEGFSANINNAVVPAKKLQHLDITFSAETPGLYTGKMVITYVNADGDDESFETGLSGTLLDPSKFYANFDYNAAKPNAYPAGSLLEKNAALIGGTVSTPNGYIYYTGGKAQTEKMFITPKLRAAAGDEFTFDAKLGSSNSYGEVTVYAAATREGLNNEDERIQIINVSGKSTEEETLATTDYKTFVATIENAGEYYLGFDMCNSLNIDEIYGLEVVPVEHEIILDSYTIPTVGVQNATTSATLKLRNIGIHDEEAGSYKILAHIGDDLIEIEDTPALPMVPKLSTSSSAGDREKLTEISIPFHSPKAGTFPIYIELIAGNYVLSTDIVEATFAEEILSSEHKVGESNGKDSGCPVNLYYKKSESIMLYTPEMLNLEAGTKITGITFKGYSTKTFTSEVGVFIEWVDETTLTKPEDQHYYNTEGMEALIDDVEFSWPKVGTDSNYEDLLVCQFNSPVEYVANKSLKIVVRSYATSDAGSGSFNFEKSTTSSNIFQHQQDGTNGRENFNSSWSSKTLPVLYLGLEQEPTIFSGTVVDGEGNAVADATVTLISNDGDNIQYEGTTDAEGAYSINVIQTRRTYDALATDGEREAYIDGIEFADGSQTESFELLQVITISDASAHNASAGNAVVKFEKAYEPGLVAVTLPIDLDSQEVKDIFGETASIFEFSGDETTGSVANAKFTEVEGGAMEAGVPYLVYLEEASKPVLFKSKAAVAELSSKTGTDVDFISTAEATPATDGMFMLNESNFVNPATTYGMRAAAVVPAYSAYLKAKNGVTSVNFTTDKALTVDVEEIEIEKDGEDVIYTIDGVRVKNPEKGIYIINGKAVRIR